MAIRPGDAGSNRKKRVLTGLPAVIAAFSLPGAEFDPDEALRTIMIRRRPELYPPLNTAPRNEILAHIKT